MRVAVITPTINSDHLAKCLSSVAQQTHEDVVHYVVVDGNQHRSAIEKIAMYEHTRTILLEENIGNGWYGHRVYAASPYLVNADVICFLDEDNWFKTNHIETMVKTLEKSKTPWCYSLRDIHGKSGEFLLPDNCESLGKWKPYTDYSHIDTSCYAIKTDALLGISHGWYGKWGADRQFYSTLQKYRPEYECTREHTVCYRLDGNEGSVKEEFFKRGNEVAKQKYIDGYPWETWENKEEYITLKW